MKSVRAQQALDYSVARETLSHVHRQAVSSADLAADSARGGSCWRRRCPRHGPQWVAGEMAIKRHRLCPSPQSR